MQLVADDKLVKILGEKGLTAEDHIVVYDKSGRDSGFILWVLEYAGAKNVSYVNGGVEALHEAGVHFTTDAPKVKATTFGGTINKALSVDNDFISKHLDSNTTLIVDARIIPQAKGRTHKNTCLKALALYR